MRRVSLVALLPYIILVYLGLAASIFTVLKPSAKIAGLRNLMALRALVGSAFQWLLNYDVNSLPYCHICMLIVIIVYKGDRAFQLLFGAV